MEEPREARALPFGRASARATIESLRLQRHCWVALLAIFDAAWPSAAELPLEEVKVISDLLRRGGASKRGAATTKIIPELVAAGYLVHVRDEQNAPVVAIDWQRVFASDDPPPPPLAAAAEVRPEAPAKAEECELAETAAIEAMAMFQRAKDLFLEASELMLRAARTLPQVGGFPGTLPPYVVVDDDCSLEILKENQQQQPSLRAGVGGFGENPPTLDENPPTQVGGFSGSVGGFSGNPPAETKRPWPFIDNDKFARGELDPLPTFEWLARHGRVSPDEDWDAWQAFWWYSVEQTRPGGEIRRSASAWMEKLVHSGNWRNKAPPDMLARKAADDAACAAAAKRAAADAAKQAAIEEAKQHRSSDAAAELARLELRYGSRLKELSAEEFQVLAAGLGANAKLAMSEWRIHGCIGPRSVVRGPLLKALERRTQDGGEAEARGRAAEPGR